MPQPNDRRATMAEVAAAAGVSVPTVSKVVNGRPDVAEATRRRVEEVLRERGYSLPHTRSRDRVGLIDLVFVPDVDLSVVRAATGLGAMGVLVGGLIWERR